MITGDYHHTALAVAKQARMVPPDSSIVIVDTSRSICTGLSSVNRAAVESVALKAAAASESAVSEEPVAGESAASGTPRGAPELAPVSVEAAAAASEPAVLEAGSAPKQQTSPQSSDLEHPQMARQLSTRSSDLRSLRARLANMEQSPGPGSCFAGLRFVDGESNSPLEPSDALASLAEGSAKCAVTGPAFELLLQHADLSASLEVVMQSAVVFARMQPQQKGQVMDLVTSRGMHQLTTSGSRFIPVFLAAMYTASFMLYTVHRGTMVKTVKQSQSCIFLQLHAQPTTSKHWCPDG